jgi:hypothetical protein
MYPLEVDSRIANNRLPMSTKLISIYVTSQRQKSVKLEIQDIHHDRIVSAEREGEFLKKYVTTIWHAACRKNREIPNSNYRMSGVSRSHYLTKSTKL